MSSYFLRKQDKDTKLRTALKSYRKDQNLTQADFAAKLGIDKMVYAKIERGWRNAGIKTTRKLVSYFQSVDNTNLILMLLEFHGFDLDFVSTSFYE